MSGGVDQLREHMFIPISLLSHLENLSMDGEFMAGTMCSLHVCGQWGQPLLMSSLPGLPWDFSVINKFLHSMSVDELGSQFPPLGNPLWVFFWGSFFLMLAKLVGWSVLEWPETFRTLRSNSSDLLPAQVTHKPLCPTQHPTGAGSGVKTGRLWRKKRLF
jgi:hypothetical protein